MSVARKAIFSILLLIGIFVAAFIFLLKGCLAKYDERSANPGILYFKNNERELIFSIVQFEKTTSYSSSQGMTRKTVSTTYYIQTNDARTGAKINSKKIIHQSDIKNHPVEVLGGDHHTAWVFMNELIAFDPFTLAKKSGIEDLEIKNPSLKNKLPAERRFYVFDQSSGSIRITAKDGSMWRVDSRTLDAKPDEEPTEPGDSKRELEWMLAQNQREQDTLYQQQVVMASRQLSAGIINRNEYNRRYADFHTQRQQLYYERDSLRRLERQSETRRRAREELQRKIKDLAGRSNIPFGQMKSNADTLNGEWFGLYSKRELEKLYDRFRYDPAYDETARRQLYTTSFSRNQSEEIIVSLADARLLGGNSYFLDGGFLLDKNTAMPLRFRDSYLYVHKNEIGGAGMIQLSRVDTAGRLLWSFNTELKEWANYICTRERLILLGTNNRELSGGNCNRLWSIDLATGKASAYDFFEDR